jgi:hypothetical protein
MSSEIQGLIWLGVLLVIYFLPTIVAVMRHTKKQAGIVLINLFLGFTVVGWLAALVWAVSAETKTEFRARIYAQK